MIERFLFVVRHLNKFYQLKFIGTFIIASFFYNKNRNL